MKRVLALLLCMALFLPALSLGESETEKDVDINELYEEDVELDSEGNFILSGEEDGDFEFSDDDVAELEEAFEIDESVDPSELYLNTNLPDDVINILLIGVDVKGTKSEKLLKEQGKYSKRADVQMILSINKTDGSIKLTSIARNTEVLIPGRKVKTLIANSYGYAIYKNDKYTGWVDTPYVCMGTVNQNFEMNIQYYVAVNFYGVVSIIEMLGGADVELTRKEASAINTYLSMRTIKNSEGKVVSHGKAIANSYDDKGGKRDPLEKKDGVQHLDGLQALMYGRLRSIDDDFHRTGRTRKLLSALLTPTVAKIKNKELDVMKLLPECGRYFVTNMNPQAMLEIVGYVMRSDAVKSMSLNDSLIEEFRIPIDGTWKYATTDSGSSVNRFVTGGKQENIEQLHTFIYGAYYPAD